MKQLMPESILPEDFEHICYNMYIEYVQGQRTMTKYIVEFLSFYECNKLGESESHKIARYF